MNTLTANGVLDVAADAIVGLNGGVVKAHADDIFSRFEGDAAELGDETERRFVPLPTFGPDPLPGGGCGKHALEFELTFIYRSDRAGIARMLGDSPLIRSAINRLRDHPAIEKIELAPVPYDYGAVPGGALLTLAVRAEYFEEV